IDDAVVVVENIERRLTLHPGEPPREVVREATDEIIGPVAGSTLTTIVVFAPLGLLSGVVGEFFRSFAIALAIAVLLSLVLAMTVIPSLVAGWALRRSSTGGSAAEHRGWGVRIPRLPLGELEQQYARAIGWMLARRRAAIAAAGVLVLASFGLSRI